LNYLAHFYLSFHQHGLVVGNFIADDVKGNKLLNYPAHIKSGIEMHRFIDHFTDTHSLCLEAKSILYKDFHKYAGVALDIYFDHFLAKNWSIYSTVSLKEFSIKTESILELNKIYFSDKMKNIFYWMKLHNWLVRYSTIEGIEKSLLGMSKRTSFPSGMERGGVVLVNHYTFLENIFNHFFSTLLLTIEKSDYLIKHEN
jgi:acyl carrier protein phosphodiesterase